MYTVKGKGQIDLIVKEKIRNTELEHLTALYSSIIKNNDYSSAEKILDLYDKLEKKELNLSFSGHFSAGKSSMINALMGEEILPNSPIPTSANIVKVNSGEGTARIYFKDDEPIEYDEPYDLDMIKNYSKDKDSIRKIDISTKKPIIPEGASIIDTPGIDAADDADRVMTESSLHIVDVLLYVMDYNHVQSEVNFQFLNSIQEKEIPFYIIINQVDKHDEKELLFSDFAQSVESTFEQWGIQPKDVFYTSLYEPNHPQNQFQEIKQLLFHMMEDRESYFNMDASLNQVIEEHKQYLKTTMEEQLADSELINVDEDNIGKLREIEARLAEIEEICDTFETDFHAEMQQTLNNAYLMPASLRDLAHSFLDSEQKDFKVGFFGSKKKTANEKKDRLDIFFQKLQENIEALVQWKLRDKFTSLIRRYELTGEQVQQKIQELAIDYTEDDLKQLVKPGAKVNGDSVLNYTNDVSADIKARYRKKGLELLQFLLEQLKRSQQDEKASYKSQLEELHELVQIQEEKRKLEAELYESYQVIDQQMQAPEVEEAALKYMLSTLEERRKPVKKATSPHVVNNVKEQTVDTVIETEEADHNKEHSIHQLLQDIDRTIETVEEMPGFDTLIKDLNEKKSSLENRSYTIALFGAFSAGKSSFANALMADQVLPVSPNPTTATVNRIRPVTEENKHRTVMVTLKDDAVLTNELKQITKTFTPQADNFHDLLQWVDKENIYDHPELNSMYQAFLHAMSDGYDYSKDYIGKTIEISLDEFPAYVADETKACYVESIDLYYDCDLTREGVTLVDTPGADSVNARHTNVAFDYIKHADAILYVTYYNHALSRADKDFLMQLGRVKEAFELDKMFFIINAADLAQDEEELNMVTDYVENELRQLGIRLPRLYPVSSKQSQENKLEQAPLNEKMQVFEERFYKFIKTDLAQLTIQSALWDMHRTKQSLEHYIVSVNLDEGAKERRQNELFQKRDQLAGEIDQMSRETYNKQIEQKIDKQLYYVQERLSIRFHDMFKETFNPTTITESGRKAQDQLKKSLNNLLEYAGRELLQEVQAVSLRMESFVDEQAAEVHKNIANLSEKTDTLFILPNYSKVELITLEYSQAFEQLSRSIFEPALKMFKGTKAFFVKNEKEEIKEAIYEALDPYVKKYTDENKTMMTDEYLEQWEQIVSKLKVEAKTALDGHIQNYKEMMSAQVDVAVLEEKQITLKNLLHHYETGDISE